MDIRIMIQILTYLDEVSVATISNIARALGMSKRTVAKYVREMNVLGLVEVNVAGRAWYVRRGPKADAFTHLFSEVAMPRVVAR